MIQRFIFSNGISSKTSAASLGAKIEHNVEAVGLDLILTWPATEISLSGQRMVIPGKFVLFFLEVVRLLLHLVPCNASVV